MHRLAVVISSVVTVSALLLVPSLAWSAEQQEIRGTVKDASGAVVARARVVLQVDGQELGRVTQPDGTFVFGGIIADSGTVVVSASGFATTTTPWHAGIIS